MSKRAQTFIVGEGTYNRNVEAGQLGLIEKTVAEEWARIRKEIGFGREEYRCAISLVKYVCTFQYEVRQLNEHIFYRSMDW